MNKSRIKSSIKNINYTFISYFIILLLQFMNRTVFIKLLASTYLGLNGLFSNVLSFLALTELGVGNAMNYALYEPIAREDTELVKSILQLYRKLYRIIGGIIVIAGIILAPFLPYLMQDVSKDIPYIYLYYLLYVVNSGASYLYTYKRSLIICNQREYISTITATLSEVLLSLLQMLILVVTRSYGLYLVAAVAVTIGENILISKVADYLYPYLKETSVKELPQTVSENIKKNIFAMMFHKIGGAVIFSSDNLVISSFAGLVSVGLYSNYSLITNAVIQLFSKFFSAITASVGNLVLLDDKRHVEQVFYRILFLNFWMRGFCGIALFCLLQPFICLWIGEEYLLSSVTVLIISVNFYIGGMRNTVLTFKDAAGIFWYDRYKPLIESLINIALSIPLAIHYGVAGVLLGTIGSTVLVPFWFEAYVLFKHYFHKAITEYMMKQVLYGFVTLSAAAGSFFLCENVSGSGIVGFVFRCVICAVVPNLVFAMVFFHTEECRYFWNFLRKRVLSM